MKKPDPIELLCERLVALEESLALELDDFFVEPENGVLDGESPDPISDRESLSAALADRAAYASRLSSVLRGFLESR